MTTVSTTVGSNHIIRYLKIQDYGESVILTHFHYKERNKYHTLNICFFHLFGYAITRFVICNSSFDFSEISQDLLTWVFAMTSAFLWKNSISLSSVSLHTPRENLPVTSGVY